MKSKYALKALIELARSYEQGYVLTAEISKKANVPRKFLEQILLELKHARIVGSKQGAKGGYYLLKSPDKVSVADIYRLFDGPIALVPCVSLNFYEKCTDCESEKNCVMRNEFIRIRDDARAVMSKSTLTSFLTPTRKRK